MSEYNNQCGPLLTPKQRRYIDHRTGYTEIGFATSSDTPSDIEKRHRQTKGKIKNDKATTSHVSTVLRAFGNDLQRIEKFYTSIEQDREAFLHLLYATEQTIEHLRREIERWKIHADIESDRMEQVEQAWKDRQIQLQDILSPLYNGLQDTEKPRQEFDERINALKTICNKELTEILRYIVETPEDTQINERQLKQELGGWQWDKWATERLEQDHAVVAGNRWGQKRKSFKPTDRGKAVYEALESLLESEYIEQYQQSGESRETAAYKALSEPHPIGL